MSAGPDILGSAALPSRVFPPARIAVALLFFANGFAIGSWAPKVPEFGQRLGLSEAELGLMILVLGIGSLTTMPVVGALMSRYGSASVLRAISVLLIPVLLLLTLAPTVTMAAAAIFLVGGVIGGMDVAMNANAIVVERQTSRAIMSSFHGFWSLGGLAGAGAGGVMIATIGVLGHVLVVTLLIAAAVAVALPMVADDRPSGEQSRAPLRLPRVMLPYLLGIMALGATVPEGAVLDWGALYLRAERGADVALSGFAYGAFAAAMALMRFAGDPVREWLGAVVTIRLCASCALIGMVLAGLAPSSGWAIAGFALAGIGISNLVPIIISAAGNLPGAAPGIMVSVVTFMAYSGILFAPSVIGVIAEYIAFSVIFTALPMLFLVVLAMSRLARYADRPMPG